MKLKNFLLLLGSVGATSLLASLPASAWTPKQAPISTKWAAQVNPKNPWPEYPRPQLVRSDWMNLNGIWEYQSGKAGDATPVGQKLASEICVPYPVESALSGVMEHHDRLWYRRSFTVPNKWKNKRVMLNFDAVDYESEVFVNGKSVGTHLGGYEPFSYDVTSYLNGKGPQELIVRVFDPTDAGGQPRGKQTTRPGGIMYTPTSGIWQTVWLEPVDQTGIDSLHIVPDVDNGQVKVTVNSAGAPTNSIVTIKVKDGGKVIQTVTTVANAQTNIPIANAKLWSPDTPFLYDLDVSIGQKKKVSDRVSSYFGMRKISIGDVGGIKKILLNNKFVFEIGPLDQGFWPEGIYTPPTEDAMKFDIEMMKKYGFNMVRKHIKVEPQRWYYLTDKLGLLVWQDMPSPNSYIGNPPPIDRPAFEKQLHNVITTHWNAPSIIMWVIFNEGQARHDTAKLVNIAKTLDPSRLTNRDSGAGYEGDDNPDSTVGDVDDVHSYPPPGISKTSPTQALVCGEYGGIGYVIKEHSWTKSGWGYTSVTDPKGLEETYGEFTAILKRLHDENGLSAAVYTQITDVEIESNGLMTYDRIIKCDPEQIAKANHFKYPVATYSEVMPTSQKTSQTWKYTTATPPANWFAKNFDDTAWQSGPGGFGTDPPGRGLVGTRWDTSDIWLRRTVKLPNLTPDQVKQLVVSDYHDEDIDVYINGVKAYSADGYVANYEHKPISDEAKAALVLGGDNVIAVHCHQTGGGQYIDVGLDIRVPPAPQ